jgi:hypothetical protein
MIPSSPTIDTFIMTSARTQFGQSGCTPQGSESDYSATVSLTSNPLRLSGPLFLTQ